MRRVFICYSGNYMRNNYALQIHMAAKNQVYICKISHNYFYIFEKLGRTARAAKRGGADLDTDLWLVGVRVEAGPMGLKGTWSKVSFQLTPTRDLLQVTSHTLPTLSTPEDSTFNSVTSTPTSRGMFTQTNVFSYDHQNPFTGIHWASCQHFTFW